MKKLKMFRFEKFPEDFESLTEKEKEEEMISGVSTASLFLRELNEDALTVLDGLGIACTEVFLTTFSEYTPEFARTLCEQGRGA